MGFTTPVLPDIDPVEFMARPFDERNRFLINFWVDNGFGTPKMVHAIYIVKLLALYVAVGLTVITLSSHVGAPWEVGMWWREPIVYQKAVLWTVFLELLGVAGSWGPLAGHFKPMTAGARYYARVGAIRLPPWPRVVPLTKGDSRTPFDVVLYLATVASVAVAIGLPGVDHDRVNALGAVVGDNFAGGIVRPWVFWLPIVGLVMIGLRDKTVFLVARSEQYLPILAYCALLDPHDVIVAGKLLIVIVWCGAAFSKLGHHFTNVVPPMVSNAPWVPGKAARRAHYRNFPEDLRPSTLAWFMAHILGTLAECGVPLVLLFSHNRAITIAAVCCIVVFHLFITSTFPLAVPLEWNILFGYIAIALFIGFPAQEGFGLGGFDHEWLLPILLVTGLFFPVLGNLRPDLVSFLPSMRQYAGNWASATWCFAPGAEVKLNAVAPVPIQLEQLIAFGYPPDVAAVTMQLPVAWRSMHSQGRGLMSVAKDYLGDKFETYTLREAEFGCNQVIGWNFGEGHLHDDQLIEAIQRRVGFEPGEFVVVWVESQPINKPTQSYFVMDAALGIVERGTWIVAEAVNEQPWLPNGPIRHEVTWQRETAPTRQTATS